MANAYKTPGVYTEEIAKLPPSIAEVETAIPAFIGYTEKAEKNGESFTGRALAIESSKEYDAYFGLGPPTAFEVTLDSTDRVSAVKATVPYHLADAMKLFFDNGGGRCHIISVDSYEANGAVDLDALKMGLLAIEKEDEPTLIVCPDAVLLDDNGLYDFQKLALAQCARLGDRFLICDTKPSNEATFTASIQEFRNNIGISELKYGAAYVPYLQSSIPRTVRFRDVALRRDGGASVPLESLTSDTAILQLIQDLKNAKAGADAIAKIVRPKTEGILTPPNKTLEDEYKSLLDAYAAAATDPAKTSAIKAVYGFTLEVLSALREAAPSATQTKAFLLRDDIASLAETTGMKAAFRTLGIHSKAFGGGVVADELMSQGTGTPLSKVLEFFGISTGDYNGLTDPDITPFYADPATDAAAMNAAARQAVFVAMAPVLKFFNAVASAGAAYEKTFDDGLEAAFGLYKQIKTAIAASSSILPPSAAVAGIYARVDNRRGVWKAPANESLNSILGPVVRITAEQQASLNVDSVAGKSVNAIRYFTGKGTLVWGARTLAGNDNEWRYVPVRRFFNFVEESCKKATEPFVFESNDANTWVKIQGMLEGFLRELWSRGALQGRKVEHAFFVSVGLGKTMTALDILEGRMIVEIGLAVVRPAEFIILRFSHKLAES